MRLELTYSNYGYRLRRPDRYGPMKNCSKCKLLKTEEEYYKKGTTGRTNAYCKSCFNLYCAERWRQKKIMMVEKFGNQCFDCQVSYHPSVYDFHHVDPHEKEFNFSQVKMFSVERMLKELAKCVLLCANCHRIRHWGDR